MKLVEIIFEAKTSPGVVQTMKGFVLSLKKIPVVAKDYLKFIINRVASYYAKALQILEKDVADVATINQLLQSSEEKMDPFKLMDLIGIGTNFLVTTSIFCSFDNTAGFKSSRIQEQKVHAGEWGQKIEKGYYDYPNK